MIYLQKIQLKQYYFTLLLKKSKKLYYSADLQLRFSFSLLYNEEKIQVTRKNIKELI